MAGWSVRPGSQLLCTGRTCKIERSVADFHIQDFEVLAAKRSGQYETGIVRPTCGDIRLKHSEVRWKACQ